MDSLGLFFVFGLVGTAGSALLLIVGLLMWRAERAAKRAKEAGLGEAADAGAKAEESKLPGGIGALFKPRPAGGNPLNAHEVLRVMRDHLTGRLIVEIAGKQYTQVGEMQDPIIHQGFVTTLQDLGSFAGGAAPAAPAPTPIAPAPLEAPRASGAERPPQLASPAGAVTPPPPRPQPAAAASGPPPTPVASSPASRVGDPLQGAAEPRPQLPSMNPFKQMQVLRERAKQPPLPPPKPIAEQIDEILQAKVTGTAQAQRGLHVRAGAQGHAVFELDGRGYEAVDDLPDADARALVRAAIAEWEQKQ